MEKSDQKHIPHTCVYGDVIHKLNSSNLTRLNFLEKSYLQRLLFRNKGHSLKQVFEKNRQSASNISRTTSK